MLHQQTIPANLRPYSPRNRGLFLSLLVSTTVFSLCVISCCHCRSQRPSFRALIQPSSRRDWIILRHEAPNYRDAFDSWQADSPAFDSGRLPWLAVAWTLDEYYEHGPSLCHLTASALRMRRSKWSTTAERNSNHCTLTLSAHVHLAQLKISKRSSYRQKKIASRNPARRGR